MQTCFDSDENPYRDLISAENVLHHNQPEVIDPVRQRQTQRAVDCVGTAAMTTSCPSVSANGIAHLESQLTKASSYISVLETTVAELKTEVSKIPTLEKTVEKLSHRIEQLLASTGPRIETIAKNQDLLLHSKLPDTDKRVSSLEKLCNLNQNKT